MTVIRCHHDSDGITTAYFTSFKYPTATIEVWNGEFGDTTGMKKGDIMCDMKPIQNLAGLIVIDHHLPHPEDRKYELFSDDVPASLIAWRMYKDLIPKSEWWKVAIGLAGDGQAELIPTEVYEACPELLVKVKTSAYKSYGKWSVGRYPVYKLLSSPVNAFLRKHMFNEALNLMKYSQQPSNILHSLKAQAAKRDVAAEFESIIKGANMYEFDNLAIFVFDSKYRMTGYIASAMQNTFDGKAIMAINKKTKRGSLRGDLAYYWRDRLEHLEYLTIGGHPGFCGLNLTIEPETLVEDIIKLM